MECLEVAVNGEPYCVAARNAAPSLSALIMQFVDRHGPDHATGCLSVHGLSADFKTHLTWGGASRPLAVGDTVTVRVLKANTADTPERSQSELSVDDDASEAVFRFGDRLANDAEFLRERQLAASVVLGHRDDSRFHRVVRQFALISVTSSRGRVATTGTRD